MPIRAPAHARTRLDGRADRRSDRAKQTFRDEIAVADHAYDLVIRSGSIADGSGSSVFEGDVGVSDGRIAAVGAISGRGREEIDARGKLVTPGFVDVHTHYDGQATWDERLQPSSWHGCTTVVMGNCGVGFAPCRPADHDRLVRLMEGVEDIPFPVLSQGLPWNWETYPDYLDALARRKFDVDVGAQLPHAALRVFVMGERGVEREPATAEDIAQMAKIAQAAAEAGALGFSTSRTLNHRDSEGRPTPTLTAEEDELVGIAMGLKAAGAGVLQFVSDFTDPEAEFALMRAMVRKSGRPLSFSLLQGHVAPEKWRLLLDRTAEANAEGLKIRAQVAGRPVGVLLGLELTMNPFSKNPVYREIAALPLAERVAAMRDSAFRERLLDTPPVAEPGFARSTLQNWSNMFRMGPDFDYEPLRSDSLQAIADRGGASPQALALDAMLESEGRGILYVPFLNYAGYTLDPAHDMLMDPNTVPGLSDGGAHVGMICDGSFPTYNLVHWTRDRRRGARIALEKMVAMQTADTAALMGLSDRGMLRPGLRADVNVIDYDRLKLAQPIVVHDLPAGGRRLMQKAEGYLATIVGGETTYRDGEPTGALPGRLLRGAQGARQAMAAG
ncbi:MAG: amidohydrolase family protein [Hyphomicrobiales bacterium]|nr:amidohydrolase family protein [Hyphomicrobiales bacterium]